MTNVCETLTFLMAVSPLVQSQKVELVLQMRLNSAQLQTQASFISVSEDRCCTNQETCLNLMPGIPSVVSSDWT